MTTHDLRAEYGLTQQDLAKAFHISLRTVQGWDYRSSCPDYVLYMMEQLLEYRRRHEHD